MPSLDPEAPMTDTSRRCLTIATPSTLPRKKSKLILVVMSLAVNKRSHGMLISQRLALACSETLS